MLKDWKKVYGRLKSVRELDEHEKILYARSLAATPEERWQLNVTFLRSLGLWGRCALKRSPKDPGHIFYIDQTLRAKKASGGREK